RKAPLRQIWKKRVDSIERPRTLAAAIGAHAQIVVDTERRKRPPSLGHHGDAKPTNRSRSRPPIGIPSKRTSVARRERKRPQIVLSNVLLPAPLAPMIAMVSPCSIARLTPNK